MQIIFYFKEKQYLCNPLAWTESETAAKTGIQTFSVTLRNRDNPFIVKAINLFYDKQ